MLKSVLVNYDNNVENCLCQKPFLLTTPKENEIVCKNCGVTFGYDENYFVENTIPSYHITKSSKVNLFQSHPEHAIYNMRKWKKMEFDMCHMWSASKKLQEIYDKQIDDTKNVKVFVV